MTQAPVTPTERASLIVAAALDAAKFTRLGDYEQARHALDRLDFLTNEQWHELMRHEMENAA